MQPLGNHAPGAEARLGTTLSGKWRLDKVLGVGGVATVYSVTHRNKSRAALKLLHVEQAQNPTVRERFVHEGYAANSIEHPGVVRVIDDDTSEEGLPYLVMELLDGETLEDRAYRHGDTLPAGDVLALVDQLLDVLVVAHEKRIIHRDIKPDNLFLTRDGRLKVLDFGIARLTQAVPNRDVTAVGTLLGTPSFMPPEQARSRWEEVDAQSDLYSVGATMFTLLSGKLVREAETLTEQLALAIHEPAPKLSSVDKTIDLQVCALVDKALAYEKRHRFVDARTMQREVRRLRELLPAPLTSSVSPAPESRRAPRVNSPEVPTLLESGRVALAPERESKPITIAIERRVATALILLLLFGAGGFVWFLIRPTPSEEEVARGAATAVTPQPAPANVEPSREEPSREEPSREEPSREEPSREEPTAAPSIEPPSSTQRDVSAAPRPAPLPNPRPAASASSAVTPLPPTPSAAPPAPAKSADPFSNRY